MFHKPSVKLSIETERLLQFSAWDFSFHVNKCTSAFLGSVLLALLNLLLNNNLRCESEEWFYLFFFLLPKALSEMHKLEACLANKQIKGAFRK